MKKQQSIAVAVALSAVVVILGVQNYNGIATNIIPESLPLIAESVLAPLAGVQTSAVNGDDGDRAWSTFQQYIAYAKARDIDGVRSLSHQVSPTCSDPNRTVECNTLMDTVAEVGSTFTRTDFRHVWSDSKQVIMSTDYLTIKQDALNTRVRVRGIIFFTKDDGGQIKVLGLNPADGVVFRMGSLTDDQISDRLDSLTLDTDKDGIADEEELCIEADPLLGACNKTDPKNRDSNGNGWWDGIESLFR